MALQQHDKIRPCSGLLPLPKPRPFKAQSHASFGESGSNDGSLVRLEDLTCLFLLPTSSGQILYGRVLWHPEQNLNAAYKLQLEKVYLCTGKDGYVPFFDPTGTVYNEGPQYGCIQPNKHLKHRFLLLVSVLRCANRDVGYCAWRMAWVGGFTSGGFGADQCKPRRQDQCL